MSFYLAQLHYKVYKELMIQNEIKRTKMIQLIPAKRTSFKIMIC